MRHKILYWISKNGEYCCEQFVETEDERSVKLVNYKNKIPKSIIGNENKTYYGQRYFWTEKERDDYYEVSQIPNF